MNHTNNLIIPPLPQKIVLNLLGFLDNSLLKLQFIPNSFLKLILIALVIPKFQGLQILTKNLKINLPVASSQ